MNHIAENLSAASAEADCLLIPVFEDGVLSEAAKQLDEAHDGAIAALLEFGDFSGAAKQTHLHYLADNKACQRIVLVGCGDKDKLDAFAVGEATKNALGAVPKSANSVTSYLADESTDSAAAATMQSVMALADKQYKFTTHKSGQVGSNEQPPQRELTLAFTGSAADAADALNQANGIAEGCQLSRDLSNQPGNICTPTYLAEAGLELGKTYDSISVEILEEDEMRELGMGSLLSVSQGSDQPGKMVVMQYNGAGDDSAPVALVGKGVTFDTGGISLKPGASMDEMKFDMVGAASVIGSLKACAEMKLPLNVVGVVAAVENMPSARATRPGDIVTSMSGKTIEVLNTDAEGRLILCDALTYVGKYKPSLVIDIATLTGACIMALGHHICAVLANDQSLADEIMASGKKIGDQAWQLPMDDDYKKQLKSAHADIGNIGGRPAGTITAACFLGHFTEDYRWAHLDIAGTAWKGKDATGRPVPLLTQFLIDQVA